MSKRVLHFVFGAVLLLSAFSVCAETDAHQSPPSYKITMVLWRGVTDAERGFMEYLKTQGINATFTILDAQKNVERLATFIDEIQQAKPDLIYTFGTTVTSHVAGLFDAPSTQKIADIPIVFNIVSDPVGARIVSHFSSSGRNVTGVSHSVPVESQLQAITDLDHFKKIAVLYNPLEMNSKLAVEALEKASKEREIFIHPVLISEEHLEPDSEMMASLAEDLANSGFELVYIPSDSLLISRIGGVIDNLHKYKLPTFSATETPIRKADAFIGIVSRYRSVGQLAGYKAGQILKEGKSPAEIPVETLKKYSFVVNMRAAKQLDYYPPVPIMQFAEVIQ